MNVFKSDPLETIDKTTFSDECITALKDLVNHTVVQYEHGDEDKDLTEGDAPCLCGNAQVEVVMVQEPHKERSS